MPLLANSQTGYSYWLEMGDCTILLDFGCDWEVLAHQLPRPPHMAIASHAHSDVSGGLLGFARAFPDIPIYCTVVTRQLLADRDESTVASISGLLFRRPSLVGGNLGLTFEPAGHLPGAALSILTLLPKEPSEGELATSPSDSPSLACDSQANRSPYLDASQIAAGRTTIYASDCSLTASRFQTSLPLPKLRQWQPELLAISGALGTRSLAPRKVAAGKSIEQLQAAISSKMTVLLPLPAIGLAQELIFMLKTNSRLRKGSTQLDLWLDESIAAACDRYLDLLPHLPKSIQNYARCQSLFGGNGRSLSIHPLPDSVEGSNGINSAAEALREVLQSPGVVLVDSAATSQFWATVWPHLIAERTLYLQLPEVYPALPLTQWPEPLRSSISVATSEWHSLSDCSNLQQIANTLKPQNLIFTHGPTRHLQDLAQLPEFRDRCLTYAPSVGQAISLNLAAVEAPNPDEQAASDPFTYAGEIEETLSPTTGKITGVEVSLPVELLDDPRWNALSETGMVTAHWDGKSLVIQAVSSQTLQREVSGDRATGASGYGENAGSCSSCAFHARDRSAPNANPRCTQPRSPLYNLSVNPRGFCAEYKALGK